MFANDQKPVYFIELDAVHLILKEEHFDTIGLCKCLKTSLQTHYHHHQTVMNTFFFVITGISNLATSTLSLFYSKVFSGKKNSENMSGKLTEKKTDVRGDNIWL